MQRKTKRTSKYSKSQTIHLPFSKKGTQQRPAAKPLTVFQSISELPLYLFIDAIADDKISGIIKSGYPAPEQLEAAWQEILLQYNEAMGDGESRLFFSLHKQILQKEITLRQVRLALEMLTEPERLTPKGILKFQDFLNGIFFSTVQIDPEDPDDYQDKLQVWKNQSASIMLAIDLKRIEYDAIKNKKKSEGQKPDRAYFQTILLNLSDYVKYEVDDKISVFEFCERIRRLNNFLESRGK